MEALSSRLERLDLLRTGDPVGPGPEQGVRVVSSRLDAPSGDEASLNRRALADLGSHENRALYDLRSGVDGRQAQDARACGEVRDRNLGEDARLLVEDSGSGGEGTTAQERFERRAEEIARAAEVGEGTLVKDPADFLPPFEEGLPHVIDERSLAGRNERDVSLYPGTLRGKAASAAGPLYEQTSDGVDRRHRVRT